MDIYEKITSRIVEIIEQEQKLPWQCPWIQIGGSTPVNAVSSRPYRGINTVVLWAEAAQRGFGSNRWLTYRQAREVGGHVRKGEHGTWIVFWRSVEKPEVDDKGNTILDEDGQPRIRTFPIARGYTVFNVEQCADLPDSVARPEAPELVQEWEAVEVAERVVAQSGAVVHHGGNRAFYAPRADVIHMPERRQFRSAEAYYATLLHELIHWTGHESRLARKFGRRFGDKAYAFEELVAELGSAFLCGALGLEPEVRDDHVAYLQHWLEVLRKDKRALFHAASQASRASDLLLGQEPTAVDSTPQPAYAS